MQHCTQYHLYTAVSGKNRWQHGDKAGYCYPSGLEKTLCKWDIHVPLVTKGLKWNDEFSKHLTTQHVNLRYGYGYQIT